MVRRLTLNILLSLLLLTMLLPGNLYADDIRLLGDLSYLLSRTDTEELETGDVTKNDTDRFKQIYRLDLSKELSPNLILDGGAQVENSKQTDKTDEFETDSRNTIIMPYVDAELRTSLYSLIAGYRERNAKRTGTDLPTAGRDYLTSYNLRAEWRPVDLPRFELNYLHSQRHDKPLTSDHENNILQFTSHYDYQNYQFLYNYLRNDDQDKIENNSTLINTHNGRVRYSQAYLDGRVTLNSSLRAEYTDQTFSGDGNRDFAVFPSGSSFYFIDDDVLPSNNNPDTDYIETADFGNNLNLNSSDIFDIGLSFGEKVEVNMLQVSLSAELDANSTIDNSANWSIYVSDDQDTWETRAVDSVEYLLDENLLQIRFTPKAEHEFIMIVYTPPLTTNQSGSVLATSIRAFVTRNLTNGSKLRSRVHNAQLGVGWQATDKTKVIYDLNFQERKTSLFDDQRIRLNNGINVIHLFNEIFTGTGRFSVGDTWEQGDHKSSNYTYSAKMTARYLETLNQSLIYSGTYNQERDKGDSNSNSVILRTNAELYRGWDTSFDQGISWQSPSSGPDSSSFFIRLQNSLAPHRRFNLIADYAIHWSKDAGEAYLRSESGRLRALWVPRDTLSLSGEIKLRATGGDRDIFWEYSASWLPFRDGTLQCNINYSEDEDRDGNRTRTFSPNLTWDITDYATLILRYSQGTEESNETVEDFQTAQITLRIYYD